MSAAIFLTILEASIKFIQAAQQIKKPHTFPDGSVVTPEQVAASSAALHASAQAGIAEREAAIEAGKTKED